jgi:hypothetical protein
VEGTRRPEELTVGEFARLADALAVAAAAAQDETQLAEPESK